MHRQEQASCAGFVLGFIFLFLINPKAAVQAQVVPKNASSIKIAAKSFISLLGVANPAEGKEQQHHRQEQKNISKSYNNCNNNTKVNLKDPKGRLRLNNDNQQELHLSYELK